MLQRAMWETLCYVRHIAENEYAASMFLCWQHGATKHEFLQIFDSVSLCLRGELWVLFPG